jgi:four helix bundle protein
MEPGWESSGRQSSVLSRQQKLVILDVPRFWSSVTEARCLPIVEGEVHYSRAWAKRGFAMSGSYRDLRAWQKAMDLVTQIYSCTRSFPKDELYGMASQLRCAAVSVPSNIAEGKGRSTDRELVLFLHHTRGSLFEVETQITIAHELNYLTEAQTDTLAGLAGEVARMLNGLIDALRPPHVTSPLGKRVA